MIPPEPVTPGQLLLNLAGEHDTAAADVELAVRLAGSRLPPRRNGDRSVGSSFGGEAFPGPVYGRPNGPALSEALREGWRKAEELNTTHPGDGKWVPLAAIDVRLEVLPREYLDGEAVKRYAATFDQLPPVLVQQDTFVLIDGRHRLAAAQDSTSDFIRIRELDVADEELEDHAMRANIAHGVPLTQTERLKAAARVFRRHHPDTGGDQAWAVAKIADWCGISRSTVHGWLRREEQRGVEADASVPPAGADQPVQLAQVDPPPIAATPAIDLRGRLGRDGKRRRLSPRAAQRPQTTTRTVVGTIDPTAALAAVRPIEALLARRPTEVAASLPADAIPAYRDLAQRALEWFDTFARVLREREDRPADTTA